MIKKIRARAPVRIDFLGGGSDAPPFSTEHGGAVVNGGLNLYATCRLEMGEEIGGVEIHSNDLMETVHAPSVEALTYDGQLDLLKAAVRLSGLQGPFRLTTDTDVPPQSGLGASASVCISVLAACRRAQGLPLDRMALADLALAAERQELGISGGRQDQLGAALGGLHAYEFKDPDVTATPIRLSPEQVAELEHRLLLIYTGVSHLSGNIHSDIRRDYQDETSPCKQAMHGLARIARQGRVALEAGDLTGFARLLNDNWRYHKDLHASCTNEHLDLIYKTAAAHGMLSGKTCGAGGGGCVVFYCEEGRKRELTDAMKKMGCVPMPFSFDFCGALAWDVS